MDVVALGELLIDFTALETDAGGYPVMAAHPGGAPANFLAALSKFGYETALLGKVGTDAFGDDFNYFRRKFLNFQLSILNFPLRAAAR